MSHILIIGAGRSAQALIGYMLQQGQSHQWHIVVADKELELAQSAVEGVEFADAVALNIEDEGKRGELIAAADIVASLLPAFLHIKVARDCLKFKKHLITASYNSPELKALDEDVRKSGLVFMGEMGLDPGIDHMSAMRVIDDIRAQGGEIKAFHSYAGGLVAPESDTNPWHYKFTWNPRNVILAGQGTAQYIQSGRLKYLPYHRLFEAYQEVDIQGFGPFEMYPNRDSLLYRKLYNLEDIPTLLRGTLRHRGFCDAWNIFVQLGLTDDSFPVIHSDRITYRQFITAFVDGAQEENVEQRLCDLLDISIDSEIMERLRWTGIFEPEKIKLDMATPAQIVEQLLLAKWKMESEDKDLILMQHEFTYTLNGKNLKRISTMEAKGQNARNTAMSRLVGLPVGIYIKQMLSGQVNLKGVHIPVMPSIYKPVLNELEQMGVAFKEKEVFLDA
jgi:saccharopine dehydrogenase (NADP+, L-glutamate forming)